MRATLLLAVICLSILTFTRASFALWNAAAPITSTTIVSGTLTATVAVGDVASSESTSAEFPPGTWSGMLPGETRRSTFTVANTGTAPFALEASLDSASASNGFVVIGVGPAPCSGDGTGEQTLTDTPAPVGQTQSASQAVTYCLSVTLSPEIPASAQNTTIVSAFTLFLTANQATSGAGA
ncbi:MAG: hypothetical protein ACHP7F_02045 [Actinomycetales bacterium]|jgi:hypothetical protein|nr:hypothetical protein [Leifsonia sp.]